jgi:hypothetical protein
MLILNDDFIDRIRLASEMPVEDGKYFYYGKNLNEFDYDDNDKVKNLVIRYNYPIYYNIYFDIKYVLENILDVKIIPYYYKDTFNKRKIIYEKITNDEIVLFFNINNINQKIEIIQNTSKNILNIKNKSLLFLKDDFIIKSSYIFSIKNTHQAKFVYKLN